MDPPQAKHRRNFAILQSFATGHQQHEVPQIQQQCWEHLAKPSLSWVNCTEGHSNQYQEGQRQGDGDAPLQLGNGIDIVITPKLRGRIGA